MIKRPCHCYKYVAVCLLLIPFLAPAQEPGRFREHPIGQPGASVVFSYFNTSPESPDGKTIAYIRCEKEPAPGRARVPASLWVCDRDNRQHRRITALKSISVHDGAEAQWVDNQRIAFLDNLGLRVVDIRTGRDLSSKTLPAAEIGHDTFDGKLLFSICEGKVPGEPGIYELDGRSMTIRTVLPLTKLSSLPIPSWMNPDSLYPLMRWQLSHLQYAPDGKHISFRIELGPRPNQILLGICRPDGSGLKAWMKPLHFLWYDNQTIAGHLSNAPDGSSPLAPGSRYTLQLWDLNGKVRRAGMTPVGNHLAISPDRTRFVSESFYKTRPVVLRLYGPGDSSAEICRFDPFEITWERKFHVNPSFSRDGKRVYYSRPVNENLNGCFYIEINE